MSTPLVSIIIPTHNRKDLVIRLIKSVLGGTYKTIEIIVVDDASIDRTSDAIKKTFRGNRKLHLVRNKRNLYTAGSRNTGTRLSKGKYLFYIDDDNVLDKHAISRLVQVFESDEKIGELGLVNMSYRHKDTVFWLITKRDMWTSRTYLPNNLRDYSQHPIWDTEDVPNAYMIRAYPIKKYGISFCEKFGIMYEDCDVSFRLRKAGYTIKVVRDAIIYHDVGDYMIHFMSDIRLPYAFARNRIIFHSVYSTKAQLLSILLVWIWAFMFYYWYKVVTYAGQERFSFKQKLLLMAVYFKGTIAGLLFVLRNEKLVYPPIT